MSIDKINDKSKDLKELKKELKNDFKEKIRHYIMNKEFLEEDLVKGFGLNYESLENDQEDSPTCTREEFVSYFFNILETKTNVSMLD